MNVPPELKISQALKLIEETVEIDGLHHKQWIIDQIVRILLGDEKTYEWWKTQFDYDWDEGIAP